MAHGPTSAITLCHWHSYKFVNPYWTGKTYMSLPSKGREGHMLHYCDVEVVLFRAVLIHYFLLMISSAYHRDTRDNIGKSRAVRDRQYTLHATST